MTDIVERLRALPHVMGEARLCAEAADEIERLRFAHAALGHRIEEAIKNGVAEYWKEAGAGRSQGDLCSYIIRALQTVLRGVPPARDPNDEPWTVP